VTEDKPFSISKWQVLRAWKDVRAKQGAAGVDGVTIAGFERKLKDNLYKLWNRLSSGSYFPPPVKRVMIHCATREEALAVKAQVEERLRACQLEAHPNKTRIVYCRDSKRREDQEPSAFDFLGYSFRPRCAKGRGQLFTGFLPAVSREAAKAIRLEIRSWGLHCRSSVGLADLSRMYNRCIQGWVNYYGRYYPSALQDVLRPLDWRLVRWAQRKYKRFRSHPSRAWQWLNRVKREWPGLLAHWKVGNRRPLQVSRSWRMMGAG
jgi:hypothetical protein